MGRNRLILVFKRPLKPLNFLGLIACFIGVTIVLSKGNISELLVNPVGIGELALLTSALSWAMYRLMQAVTVTSCRSIEYTDLTFHTNGRPENQRFLNL